MGSSSGCGSEQRQRYASAVIDNLPTAPRLCYNRILTMLPLSYPAFVPLLPILGIYPKILGFHLKYFSFGISAVRNAQDFSSYFMVYYKNRVVWDFRGLKFPRALKFLKKLSMATLTASPIAQQFRLLSAFITRGVLLVGVTGNGNRWSGRQTSVLTSLYQCHITTLSALIHCGHHLVTLVTKLRNTRYESIIRQCTYLWTWRKQ